MKIKSHLFFPTNITALYAFIIWNLEQNVQKPNIHKVHQQLNICFTIKMDIYTYRFVITWTCMICRRICYVECRYLLLQVDCNMKVDSMNIIKTYIQKTHFLYLFLVACCIVNSSSRHIVGISIFYSWCVILLLYVSNVTLFCSILM